MISNYQEFMQSNKNRVYDITLRNQEIGFDIQEGKLDTENLILKTPAILININI